MKRDMDILRQVLLEIEEHERVARGQRGSERREEFPVLEAHFKLGADAGFITGRGILDGTSIRRVGAIGRLSSEGCDFLNRIRDDDVWERIKETVRRHGRDLDTVSLELIDEIAGNIELDLFAARLAPRR